MAIAVDFDDTLNKQEYNGEKYNPKLDVIEFLKSNNKDDDFFLVTARKGTESNISFIKEFMIQYGLDPVSIHFTDRDLKGPLLKRLNALYLIDDNEKQRQSSIDHGIDAYHPDDIGSIYDENVRKAFFKSLLKKIS